MVGAKKTSVTAAFLLTLLVMLLLPGLLSAQKIFQGKVDSLSALLAKPGSDTGHCRLLANLSQVYANNGYTIKGLEQGEQALHLAKKLK